MISNTTDLSDHEGLLLIARSAGLLITKLRLGNASLEAPASK